jgi:hypothetical protein
MFQKSKIILLLISFLAGFMVNVKLASAVRDIQVTVKPRRISTRSTYLLRFKLEAALQVHDWIKVIWPKESKLPVLPEDPSERKAELKRIIESIFIGTSPCSACQGYPEINYKENSIRFNIHLELNPNIHGYEEINITITDRVGIINPSKPGKYELKISTAREQTPSKSIPYEIVESSLGEPDGKPVVIVSPNGNHAMGEYRIKFNVGTGGALVFNQSRVRIQFPLASILSKKADQVQPYQIKVNNKPVMNKIMIADQVLTFISPVNTENSESIEIILEKGVGIINPSLPGAYTLKVSTSEDPDWVDSFPYLIEQNFESLSIAPNKANRYASFEFQFLSNKKMEENCPIYILFPETVVMPTKIELTNVYVNQKQIKAITLKDHLVLIFLYEKVAINSVLAINFSQDCHIKNPAESTFLKLAYRLSEQEWIEKTIFSIQSIIIDPPNALAKSSYSFQLLVDLPSGVSKDSFIKIKFPNDSYIPEIIQNYLIYINGQKVSYVTVISVNEISIQVPFNITFDTEIYLTIDRLAGILNPPIGNQLVTFEMVSSIDQSLQVKKDIFIYPPLPKTEIKFVSGKQGKNDWFIKAPVMDFYTSEKGCKTYFFWNGVEENILEFVEPKVLPDGQYQTIISYYSESPYGKEEVKTVSLKVDTVMPVLIMNNPTQRLVKTNQTTLFITGSSQAIDFGFKGENIKLIDKLLLINNDRYAIHKEDGSFSIPYVITPDEQELEVRLEDEAGNSVAQYFAIDYKVEKPYCIINNPAPDEWIQQKVLRIIGQVDPGSAVSVDEQEAKISDSGSFFIEVSLTDPGYKKVILRVKDLYGNIGEYYLPVWHGFSIQMWINSLQAVNNNRKKILDLAPFIREGRTMVPFRFLGEELQANVSFEKDPKTKQVSEIRYQLDSTVVVLTIGSLEGIVNGKKVLLDLPPLIIKGRTVVPLRFITENLGCKTYWDPNKKGILVTYA